MEPKNNSDHLEKARLEARRAFMADPSHANLVALVESIRDLCADESRAEYELRAGRGE